MKQNPAQKLLERLWLGQDQVLAFLDELTIPFDNNRAERALRLLTVQQKVLGSFRSLRPRRRRVRLPAWVPLYSQKTGGELLAALETVIAGQPLCPAFA